jgi:hypothetical protein
MIMTYNKKKPNHGDPEMVLIECTRQPGSLRITKRTCARRYLLSKDGSMRPPRTDFFMSVQSSLEICGKCPVGRRQAEKLVDAFDGKRRDQDGADEADVHISVREGSLQRRCSLTKQE